MALIFLFLFLCACLFVCFNWNWPKHHCGSTMLLETRCCSSVVVFCSGLLYYPRYSQINFTLFAPSLARAFVLRHKDTVFEPCFGIRGTYADSDLLLYSNEGTVRSTYFTYFKYAIAYSTSSLVGERQREKKRRFL